MKPLTHTEKAGDNTDRITDDRVLKIVVKYHPKVRRSMGGAKKKLSEK